MNHYTNLCENTLIYKRKRKERPADVTTFAKTGNKRVLRAHQRFYDCSLPKNYSKIDCKLLT